MVSLSLEYLYGAFESRECISESIKHRAQCAVCKTKATRRDIARDATMDTIVSKFAVVEGYRGDLVDALCAVETEAREDRGRTQFRSLLPWVQGVHNEEYRSPSRSFSGTALEELRNREGEGASRSASPCSMERAVVENKNGEEVVLPTQELTPSTSMLRPKPVHKVIADVSGGRANNILEGNVVGVPESPNSECASQAGRQIDDILAGLESAHDGETPGGDSLSLAAPKSIASMDSPSTDIPKRCSSQEASPGVRSSMRSRSSKRTPENMKSRLGDERGNGGQPMEAKTAKRARLSRKAIEEARTPVDENSHRRRIPARLLPWSCILCTFDNKGSSLSCEMCGQAKGSDAPCPSPAAIKMQEDVEMSATKKKKNRIQTAETSHIMTATPVETGLSSKENTSRRSNRQKTKQGRLTAAKKKGSTKIQNAPNPKRTATDTVDNVITDANGWQQNELALASKFVVSGSGLDTAEREILKEFSKQTGAKYEREWSSKITHIICGAEQNDGPKRTFKYLMGKLCGKHIVHLGWLKDSMEAKKVADASTYRIGAKEASTGSKNTSTPLLCEYEIQVQGPSTHRQQLICLLEATGAHLVKRLPSSTGKLKPLIVVVDGQKSDQKSQADEIVTHPWYGRALGAAIPVVRQAWISESIVQERVMDPKEYLIT